jgi:hypothetical protein
MVQVGHPHFLCDGLKEEGYCVVSKHSDPSVYCSLQLWLPGLPVSCFCVQKQAWKSCLEEDSGTNGLKAAAANTPLPVLMQGYWLFQSGDILC